MELHVKDATVKYRGFTAVDSVDWRLGVGFHALLGPNGAGKSSLMRCVVTLQKPASGTITLDGDDGKELRARVGYCPQDNLGKSGLTIRQHLAYLCWLRRIDSKHAPAEIDRVLEFTDLADRADQRIRALSGGMRRRVSIGSALIGRPDLVVLDEPSAGLDVAQRDALSRILGRLSTETITVVSTHIVEDIVGHADTITVMDHGQFKFFGPFDQFCENRDVASIQDRYLAMVSA